MQKAIDAQSRKKRTGTRHGKNRMTAIVEGESEQATAEKPPARKKRAPRGPTKKPASTSTTVRRHPWDEIRKAYVEGWSQDGQDDNYLPNMRELSEHFDVPHVRIREKSARERWADRRQAFAAEVIKERQRKRAVSLAKNAIEFDERAYNVAKLGIGMVTTRLAEIAQEVQRQQPIRQAAIEAQARGEAIDKMDLWSAVRYKELEGLASAAERFQTIGQKALGTDVQKHEITGADGGVIEGKISIGVELGRDDPERLAMLLNAMQEAGLTLDENDPNIIEGDVIDEDESSPITQPQGEQQ